MGVINYIEFGGVKSSDYGIYVSGEGTFNASERDVELIEIPGRNGDFSLDKGRFKNITVTYPVFNYEPNLTDFRTRLSDFRNALKSKIGYQRLEDTFHPDEYRLATFIDAFEVQPVMYNTASAIELTFNCKPQRFLKSGEEPQTIGEWGETETVSGSIATFEAESNTGIKSLVANIEPFQSGSGDPSPTNVRTIYGWDSVRVWTRGKNIFQNTATSTTSNGITFTVNADGTVSATGTATGTAVFNMPAPTFPFNAIEENVILTGCPQGGDYTSTYSMCATNSGGSVLVTDTGSGATMTPSKLKNFGKLQIIIRQGTTIDLLFEPMIRVATDTDSTFEAYKEGQYFSESLGRTVYGGTLDLISGVLTVDRASVSYNGTENWSLVSNTRFYLNGLPSGIATETSKKATSISNQAKYNDTQNTGAYFVIGGSGVYVNKVTSSDTLADFKSRLATNPFQLEYPLATPQTYQLTAEQISTILGVNNIWADSGEVSVEFGEDPNIVLNPTPFESQPLLEVGGYGAVYLDEQKVSIAQAQPIGNITLWNGTEPPKDIGFNFLVDLSKFNTGDKFYVSMVYSLEYNSSYEFTRATEGSGTSSSANFIINNVTLTFDRSKARFDALSTDDLEFTVGTTSQYYTTFTITTTNPSTSMAFTLYVVYDATTGRISIMSGDDNANVGADGEVYGYSSLVIQANTFIDCEIGEAYYIEDGEVISANNSVTLPAILPKLKAGNNPITHDDTITDLKITPRYWKI